MQPSRGVGDTPVVARGMFGARLDLAERYVALLADTGISHGLIGPREAPRLWDRHVINCAVTAGFFDPAASVIDLGSGAGLPGLVLAIARPDLRLHLVEPLLRRTTWLESAVRELGLTNVRVHRARGESFVPESPADHVTARAVTGLDRLVELSFPLLRAGGSLVALKGANVAAEIEAAAPTLRRYAVASTEVREAGVGVVDPPTTLVIVTAGAGHRSGTPTRSPRRSGDVRRSADARGRSGGRASRGRQDR